MNTLLRSNDERDALVTKLMPVARRVGLAWVNIEDGESECLLKLIELIDATPDSSKLTTAYVGTALRNHLRGVYKASPHRHETASLDAMMDEKGFDVKDGRPDSETELVLKEESEATDVIWSIVEQTIAKLSEHQRKTLNFAYGLGGFSETPMTEVAKWLRVSRKTAYKYLNAAIIALRTELKSKGYPSGESDVEEVLLARAA
jgi:DNA-directed RNA polymerase specialized sigma24 family protein